MEERDVNQITNQEISETVSDAVPKKNRKPLIIGIILGFILIASIIGVASFKYIKDMQDIKVVKRKFYTKLEQALSERWDCETSKKKEWKFDYEEVIDMIDKELKILRKYKNVKILDEEKYAELENDMEKAWQRVYDLSNLAEDANVLIEEKEEIKGKNKEKANGVGESIEEQAWEAREGDFFEKAESLGYSINDIGNIYRVENLLKDAEEKLSNYESRVEIQEFNKKIASYIEALELLKIAIERRDEVDAKNVWDRAYMQRYEALIYFVDNGFEINKDEERDFSKKGESIFK